MKTNNSVRNTEEHLYDHEWRQPHDENGGLHVVRSAKPTHEEELRLEELDARLQELHVASNLIWLKNGLDNRDPVVDLRTKVESVRWMLRIAKHLKLPAREMLFATIKRSLDQIEHTVELGVCASEISQPRERVHA